MTRTRLFVVSLWVRFAFWRMRFRAWLFGTPTTMVEAINAGFLLTWALTLLDDRLVALPMYAGLAHLTQPRWANICLAAVFAVAFLFSLVGWMHKRRWGGEIAGGFAMLLGGVLWCVVAANFWALYPPVNPGVMTYALLAVFCWICGGHLFERGLRGRDEHE